MAEALPVLYLAGPMSGLPEANYPAFHAAAASLRRAGFEVLNPAENRAPSPEPEWSDWMRLALGQLIRADGVAFLTGAGNSRGAALEMKLGDALGMEVRPWRAWITKQRQDAYMARLLESTTQRDGASK
ncbi:nucleoside dexoyribosyltransferase [Arthrobacter phage Ruchi]|nr:nucleoside deoxyribosyltransferase [Arthrobacter phage Basilisk]WNM69498.1 nucleoside dexoyribosyltransferase [Arthrobacter phage Ruchi]